MSFFSRIRKVLHDPFIKDGGQECPPYRSRARRPCHIVISGAENSWIAFWIKDGRGVFEGVLDIGEILQDERGRDVLAGAEALQNADQVGVAELEAIIAAAGQTPDHFIEVGAEVGGD